MRNILEYPITQDEKKRFVERLNEGVGSIEPMLLRMHATEFSIWMWGNVREYMRGGFYTVDVASGLDTKISYTVESLYHHWLKTIWMGE